LLESANREDDQQFERIYLGNPSHGMHLASTTMDKKSRLEKEAATHIQLPVELFSLLQKVMNRET
jgi:hypothetical protein